MKRVKLDDQVYDFPESWKEVNVKQFVDLSMYKNDDIISLLAILMQAPYDIVFCMDDKSIEALVNNLDWYREDMDWEALPRPDTINIGGIEFEPPTDIRLKSYGQKIHFEQKMLSLENPIIKMAYAVGVYMYPVVTGKQFDDMSIDRFVQEKIMKCRILQVYPWAAFFLDNWMPLTRRKRRLLIRNLPKKKLRQG